MSTRLRPFIKSKQESNVSPEIARFVKYGEIYADVEDARANDSMAQQQEMSAPQVMPPKSTATSSGNPRGAGPEVNSPNGGVHAVSQFGRGMIVSSKNLKAGTRPTLTMRSRRITKGSRLSHGGGDKNKEQPTLTQNT